MMSGIFGKEKNLFTIYLTRGTDLMARQGKTSSQLTGVRCRVVPVPGVMGNLQFTTHHPLKATWRGRLMAGYALTGKIGEKLFILSRLADDTMEMARWLKKVAMKKFRKETSKNFD